MSERRRRLGAGRPGVPVPQPRLQPLRPPGRPALQNAAAVLFGLSGTLVHYWDRGGFAELLGRAIRDVRDLLRGRGLLRVDPEAIAESTGEENVEEPDHRVRPLHDRLCHIFDLEEPDAPAELLPELGRRFTRPLLAEARLYDDVPDALRLLRTRGYALGVVANTIWGAPGHLWREHLREIGLAGDLDVAVFCTDVGWRKPAPLIYRAALDEMGLDPDRCVFVGDSPQQDIAGARMVGMQAILIDRQDRDNDSAVAGLDELSGLLAGP